MPDPRVHLREPSASREDVEEGKAVSSPSSGQRGPCDGGCSYSRAVRGTKDEVRTKFSLLTLFQGEMLLILVSRSRNLQPFLCRRSTFFVLF